MKRIIIMILAMWSVAQAQPKVLLEAAGRKAMSDTSNGSQQSNSVVGWGDSMTAGFGLGSSDSTWLNVFKGLSLFNVENYGVSGETSTQVFNRFAANPQLWGRNQVIYVGRNSPDSATDNANIKKMVDTLTKIGNDRYVIFTVLNRTNETNGTPGFNTIQSINNGYKNNFPGHVLDTRRMIINAYNPSLPADVTAYNDSIPPPSLMITGDPIHINGMGHRVIGVGLYNNLTMFTGDKILTEGSFGQIFRKIRLNTDNNELFSGSTFRMNNGYIGLDTRRVTYPLNIGWKVNPAIRLFGSLDDSVNVSFLDIGFNSAYFSINAGTLASGAVRPLRVGTNSGGIEFGQVISGLQKGISTITGTANGNNTSIGGVYGSLTGGANNNAFAILPTLTKTDVGSSGSVNALWVSVRKQSTAGAGDKNFASFGYNSADRGTGVDTALATIDSAGNYVSNAGAFFGAVKRVAFANSQAKKTSALVQMNSLTQGFMPPRMTAAQRLAISVTSADSSLIVFDKDSSRLMVYDGAAWVGLAHTNNVPLILTQTATLDFPSIATGTTGDMTMAVTGAVLGDGVTVAKVGGFPYSGAVLTAWVSAADTVTVRILNVSGSPIDPASDNYKVKVLK